MVLHVPLGKVPKALPLLLNMEDCTLVHRALDLQKDGPSPSLDEVSPKVYRVFEDFFVPLMHHTYRYLLGGGELLHDCSVGVQVIVPKGGFSDSMT